MSEQPEATPEEQDVALEPLTEEDDARYPGQGRPDELRERVGLEESGGDSETGASPPGPPPPRERETGAPTPSSDD